ncbi:MAG: c-type cytochrome [Terriglobales bacterium]
MRIEIPRRLLVWGVIAIAAVLGFGGILATQSRRAQERWSTFLAASPVQGRAIFKSKGCVRCHAVNGVGGTLAPDLGRSQPAQSSVAQLVTAMWNHAPQMWDRMRVEKVSYPSLTYEEVAQLLAYLYISRRADEAGDAAHGKQLFAAKGCVRCHAVHGQGGTVGPDLAEVTGVNTPMAWTQAMWNHGSVMQAHMHDAGVEWPRFEGHELRDLFAYARQVSKPQPLAGDPEHGWKVFQGKSCTSCHAIKDEEGERVGPNLGPSRNLPPTFTQFGSLMWNHAPQMERAMRERGIERPQFGGEEMADLFAFLYSLRYVEPTGSPHVGESVFSWRGCSRCHGAEAQGTGRAPALRGRGRSYTSVALATELWAHGGRMYRESQQIGIGWPTLSESDVGDLLAFLNAPVQQSAHK